MPKAKEVVKNYFPKCKINDSINPDEAVAYGAAIDAEKRLYNRGNAISNIHLYDITPLSLGIEVVNQSNDSDLKKEGNEMSVIIKRGTHVPTQNNSKYQHKYENLYK